MKQRILSSAICAALLGAVLAGCATTASGPLSTASVAPYSDNVELNGKFSVTYSKDGRPSSLTVNFNWVQQGPNTEVSLLNPLGTIEARLSVTPQSATLTPAGKQPISAPDVDALTARVLGWTLPVSGLRDWLQGYATDAQGQRFAASPAKDTVVTRDGWKLHYAAWQDGTAAVPKPKRIDVTRIASSQVDELTLRIAILPPE
ncbi:outer membrane lipoprotein LolB [Oxalobacteraceae bacterium A2-2]